MTDKEQLSATFKSQDTEEWLDIRFTRPLGLLWARLFRRWGVHPNVVTLLSIVLGVAAGVLFYFESLPLNVAGILLLVWANLYDSADGQLARMTGQKTRWGRILDGFAGDVWFFTVYAAICLRLQHADIPFTHHRWGIWIWLSAALSGLVCHAKQCQLADYYRNIHLYFLKGASGSELDSSAKLSAEFRSLSWRTDGAWKLFLFFYNRYTRAQEALTPAYQAFKADADRRFGRHIPAALAEDFRRGSLPLMKWANILTFNTRAIVLYAAILVAQPWIYMLFELTVLNVIFFHMRRSHENLCRRLQSRIDSYETAV